MSAFINTYYARKKEIEDFIQMLFFLEEKERTKYDERSMFDTFFHSGGGIDLSYQELINILKSNLSLMIYNLIEFTVTNLMENIYDKIRLNNLSYVDVSNVIRNLWSKAILKAANDPSANFNTFVRKNNEIIEKIISKSVIELKVRDTLPAGNLDGVTIRETFEKHGININVQSSNYRPDILSTIKNSRNNLAHGTISFSEAVREDAITDLQKNEKVIVDFLEEIIELVRQYISEEGYKAILV